MFTGSLMMGRSGVVTITYTVNPSQGAATVYTFSAADISTAAADRKIVVGIQANDGGNTVSSVTVGGISASLVIALDDGNSRTELWQADVPTGTTADIVVTFSGGANACDIGVWAVYGAAAAAHHTASSSANPPSANLNIPANGVAIGVARENGSGVLSTWTNLTERFDRTSGTGASDAFVAAETGRTITCTPAAGGAEMPMVLASWAPA